MRFKIYFAALVLSGMMLPGNAQAEQIDFCMIPQMESSVASICAEQLKDWYNDCREMIVIDARKLECDDGQRLPTAINFSFCAPTKVLYEAIPCQNSLIVVYGLNSQSAEAVLLAERLQKLGYSRVYVYCEGLEGWISDGLPIDREPEALVQKTEDGSQKPEIRSQKSEDGNQKPEARSQNPA